MFTEQEFNRMIQDHLDLEAERILEEVNSDPTLRDVVAPKEIEERLFKQIREYEMKRSKRTVEEQELIRLGKIYKKNYKRNRVLVAVLAAVCGLSVGITCLGGPQKIVEKVEGMLEGVEQTNVDSDDNRTEGVPIINEDLAYRQIEEKFDFYPVRLDYIPEDMEFYEATVDENLQKIQLVYYKDGQMLSYVMVPNNRTGSLSTDIEDSFLEEYTMRVQGTEVCVKQYLIEENHTIRWKASFEHQDVQYAMLFIGLEEAEVTKVIENLYFS